MFDHRLFLNLTLEELESERRIKREDYKNLSSSSLCCSVITQTLQQLQIIKENYEDGALCMLRIDSEEVRHGFEKVLEGLEKHMKLQQNLLVQFDDVVKLHDEEDIQKSRIKSDIKEENLCDDKDKFLNIEKFVQINMDSNLPGGDETEIMQDVARIQNYKIKIEEEYVEHVENEENFDDAYEQFMMSEGVFDCKSEVKKIKKGLMKGGVRKCKECGESFTSKKEWILHRREHKGRKPDICKLCGEAFHIIKEFKIHMKGVHGVKPYQCEVCGKSFNEKKEIRDHHGKVHSGVKPFICDLCGKAFSIQKSLKEHKKQVHTVERPFTCEICEKSFKFSNALKSHHLVHSNEKPFSCEVCGKSFNQKPSLDRHRHMHSGTAKKHPCDVCGKIFARKDKLKAHLRIHTGEKLYTCEYCDKGFIQKRLYTDHIRSNHTGEKPYQCTLCDKAYSLSGSLRDHMRVHTGLRPFSCEQCGNSFYTSQHLKRHQLKSCAVSKAKFKKEID